MRPGEIIDCPLCGKKHELIMARIKEIHDPDKTITPINKAVSNFLLYECGRKTMIACIGSKSYLSDKKPWYVRIWNRIYFSKIWKIKIG